LPPMPSPFPSTYLYLESLFRIRICKCICICISVSASISASVCQQTGAKMRLTSFWPFAPIDHGLVLLVDRRRMKWTVCLHHRVHHCTTGWGALNQSKPNRTNVAHLGSRYSLFVCLCVWEGGANGQMFINEIGQLNG